MLNEVPAVTQKTKDDCGAASCSYILQMLGLARPQDAELRTIMKRTYSQTDFLGPRRHNSARPNTFKFN